MHKQKKKKVKQIREKKKTHRSKVKMKDGFKVKIRDRKSQHYAMETL